MSRVPIGVWMVLSKLLLNHFWSLSHPNSMHWRSQWGYPSNLFALLLYSTRYLNSVSILKGLRIMLSANVRTLAFVPQATVVKAFWVWLRLEAGVNWRSLDLNFIVDLLPLFSVIGALSGSISGLAIHSLTWITSRLCLACPLLMYDIVSRRVIVLGIFYPYLLL